MKRKSSRTRRGPDAGFSLVEVMVAMTFLGVGLLAIAQLIPYGMKGVTDARVRTNAVQSAQRILDDLRATEYDDASLTAGNYTLSDGQYDLAWTVVDNTPIPGMKRVDLTATWGEGAVIDTVALSTYITPNK